MHSPIAGKMRALDEEIETYNHYSAVPLSRFCLISAVYPSKRIIASHTRPCEKMARWTLTTWVSLLLHYMSILQLVRRAQNRFEIQKQWYTKTSTIRKRTRKKPFTRQCNVVRARTGAAERHRISPGVPA